MSALKRLISREIKTTKDTIPGVCLSNPVLFNLDGGTSGVWVVDVDIGVGKILRDVPVKSSGRDHFYAQIGLPVTLRRTARGRVEVIGPGERVAGINSKVLYTFGNTGGGTPLLVGFTTELVPFSYYATIAAGATLGVIFGNGTTPFNYSRILNAYGVPVP